MRKELKDSKFGWKRLKCETERELWLFQRYSVFVVFVLRGTKF